MQKILFIFFIFFNIIIFAQVDSSEDLIEWTESGKLEWSNFQCEPDENLKHIAVTSSYITISFQQVGFSEAKITVRTLFDKTESWVKHEADYILKHEQLHFDIKELYSRKLRKAITEAQCNNIKELKMTCLDLHDKYEIEVNNYQSLYDD